MNRSVNVYPCGVIISPTAPWLAASPDRRIVCPSRDPPFGLLEIKAPQAVSLENVECLCKANGHYKLKQNHNYFYQIQCQLAVTGLLWSDFIVYLPNNPEQYHIEHIQFDPSLWQQVKNKLDYFYFSYFM